MDDNALINPCKCVNSDYIYGFWDGYKISIETVSIIVIRLVTSQSESPSQMTHFSHMVCVVSQTFPA